MISPNFTYLDEDGDLAMLDLLDTGNVVHEDGEHAHTYAHTHLKGWSFRLFRVVPLTVFSFAEERPPEDRTD